MSYTANVIEICENGDAILELPQEMLDDLGWDVGTVLNIEEQNGQIILNRANTNDIGQASD
jgi:bifunctional DNA-binding transcriptional regulator/antitoxin component of YhaV-PrlF toxin-antitoxin module